MPDHFRHRLGSRLFWLAAGLLAGCRDPSVPAPVEPNAYWRAVETFELNQAARQLGVWRDQLGPSRAWRFAAAIHLLQRQPRTAANVAEALQLLQELAASDDEIAVTAHYFVARIYDYHAIPPRRALANAEYRLLLERFPGRLQAEMGLASLAANRLFATRREQDLTSLFDELEGELGRLRHAAARRACHYVLADAALRLLNDHERAIRHLEELWNLHPRIYGMRADTLVKLGEVNLALKRYDAAAYWYREFLLEFSDEARSSWIADRLREAEKRSLRTIK